MGFWFWFFAMDFCFLDSDGWILDFNRLDFGIPMGFGLDSDWLVWVGVVGMVVVWGWCGGDCGGSFLVVMGHCGGFVWSSLVTMVGLFGRCWSWWGLFLLCSSLFIVLVWFKMILFVFEWFVVTRKLDGGGGGGGGWMRQSKRNGDYREVRNTFYIILMYCMVK